MADPDLRKNDQLIYTPKWAQGKDFTVFVKRSVKRPDNSFQKCLTDNGKPTTSYEGQATLKGQRGEDLTARAAVVSCMRGNYHSATFRITEGDESILPAFKAPDYASIGEKKLLQSTFHPHPAHPVEAALKQLLAKLMSDGELTGMVYITGATNSGKNYQARCLIHNILTHKHYFQNWSKTRKRNLHLLTYEDPIETVFTFGQNSRADLIRLQKYGIDYTPRELRTDVSGIREFIKNALRQTPSICYISETREQQDLKRLVDFAGTGHLVVTTGHASSLREAVGKLLAACGAEGTPAARKEVADKLCSVVHLLPKPIPKDKHLVFPAVFLANREGRQALMAEGRSCLLPRHSENSFTLGRRYFVNMYLEQRRNEVSKKVRKNLETWSLQKDLSGI